MKLIKCYVENFGILHRYECTFGEGINCHISVNGSGKSTLAAFIRAMLYGLGDNRRASLDENERKRYTPWQGGAFGGSLTFSRGDEIFTVERSFGARPSQDTCTLRRLSDGAVLDTGERTVGEVFLDIDRDGFSSTLFISDRSIGVGSSSSVAARISDMLDTSSDGVDNALKRLRDKARLYEKRGGGGEIADTRAKIYTCNSAIEAAEAHAESAEASFQRMHEISTRLKSARGERERLFRSSVANNNSVLASDAQAYFLQDRIRSEKEKLNAVMHTFKSGIPREEELDRAEAKYRRAKLMNSEADVQGHHCPVAVILLLFLGVVLIGAGLTLGIIGYPIAYIGCAIGASVLIISIVLALHGRGARRKSESSRDERARLLAECEAFLSHFNTVGVDPFSEIRRAIGEYEYTTALIDRLNGELRGIKEKSQIDTRSDVLSVDIVRLDGEIAELERAYALTEREYRASLDRADELDELLARRTELVARLERYTKRLEILKKTEQMLEKASARLAASHIDGLRRSLEGYANMMSEDEGEFTVDTELRISKVVGASARASESFSRGLRDLYTLALKLALTDTVYKGITPFVILDDPFAAFDDGRCAMAKDMLRRIGKERQIIYFTCSRSRGF